MKATAANAKTRSIMMSASEIATHLRLQPENISVLDPESDEMLRVVDTWKSLAENTWAIKVIKQTEMGVRYDHIEIWGDEQIAVAIG